MGRGWGGEGGGGRGVGWVCFFFNDTATTEIYTLSLHDALPISFIISLASLWVAVVRGRSGEILPIVVGLLSVITFGGIGGLILFVRHQGGIVIWDASVYYFSIIPNNVDWPSASVTLIGAVLFCLLGAVIPAAKAADTDPVKALRHE